MKKIIYIVLLLFTFSCEPPQGECVILDADFIPMIKAEIEGSKYYFLIDTGASLSVVDLGQFRKEFPNKRIGSVEDNNVQGYGGSAGGLRSVSLKVRSGTLHFNRGWKAKDISNIVEVAKVRTGRKILGIIGNNNLKGKVVDLASRRIYYPENK